MNRERGFSFLSDVDEEEDLSESLLDFEFNYTVQVDFLEGAARKKRAVIALDFGSTHSGFSYALTDKKEIKCELKKNGLFKEPTCALFEKSGELIAFGMKAREKYLTKLATSNMLSYATKLEEDYAHDFLYFDYNKLKMRLYGDHHEEALSEVKCRSANGVEVRLDRLVTAILSQLRLSALAEIAEREGMEDLAPEDCLWVLTVPAIWLEVDKQFMRSAAVDAGIIDHFHSPDLVLALEPECAAIRLYTLRGLELREGQKLLTLDCGGGTVDFCALQVTSVKKGYRFRQLLEPTGGNWGATYIDDNFFKLLKKVLGKDAFHRGMLVSAAQNDIHSNWEQLKLNLRAVHFMDSHKGVSFELKNLLTETKQSLPSLVSKYNSVHKVPLDYRRKGFFKGKSTKLILTPKVLRKIFDPVIRMIVGHTGKLLVRPELEGLEGIILVGGFGQCEYLRFQLKKALKLKEGMIVVPKDSSSVVMTGAVNFGLQPSVIESRKCALTIGMKSALPFDKEVHTSPAHLAHKKFDKKRGINLLNNVFVPLVRKGQEVAVDEEVSQRFVSGPGMSSIKFDIYASRMTDIAFVDDENCLHLGRLVMSVDDKVDHRQTFTCNLKVGFTELFARVVNETTGKESNLRIDFSRLGNQAIEKHLNV